MTSPLILKNGLGLVAPLCKSDVDAKSYIQRLRAPYIEAVGQSTPPEYESDRQ
ncbi:hypothetical protein ACLOJK_026327 [Asimina triloba]